MTLRVLFVEDQEDDMLLVISALEKEGFEIDPTRVETEKGMREALSNSLWDVVIADYSMPSFSGEEALKIYNEFKPDIPFFLVSGSVGEEIAVQMMRDGASDYIMKDNLTKIPQAVKRELNEFSTRRKKKEIEEELRKASIIISSTDVILWQWKPEKGRPVIYTSQNVRQFGYEPGDFTSEELKYEDVVYPEDRSLVFDQATENLK